MDYHLLRQIADDVWHLPTCAGRLARFALADLVEEDGDVEGAAIIRATPGWLCYDHTMQRWDYCYVAPDGEWMSVIVW